MFSIYIIYFVYLVGSIKSIACLVTPSVSLYGGTSVSMMLKKGLNRTPHGD